MIAYVIGIIFLFIFIWIVFWVNIICLLANMKMKTNYKERYFWVEHMSTA